MPDETEELRTQELTEAPAGALPPPDASRTEPERLFCPQCGASMLSTEQFCGSCGWDANRPDEAPRAKSRREPPPSPRRLGPPSDRSRLTTFLLCLLLGYFGVHRFYVGRTGSGVLWLVTFGIFSIGWIYDLVMIATGEFVDEEGKRIIYWQ